MTRHASRCGVLPGLVLAMLMGSGWASIAAADSSEQAGRAERTEQTGEPEAQATGSIGQGLAAYQRYCRTCHGKTGKGDGTIVKWLKVPPSDLTLLSGKNDGEFPAERVRRAIDGREEVRLHGPREMPIWGEVLQDGEGESDETVRHKIEDLIAYLKSIQVREAP